MKVFMVGEAAAHREVLEKYLMPSIKVAELPAESAWSDVHDGEIAPDDAIITLNFKRKDNAAKFRLLHIPGAGVDGIDTAALPDGAILCNVYEHQIPIAEYVIHAILEWQIRLCKLAAFDPEKWTELYAARSFHGELCGKTVGIVGYGGIGHEIARRAAAFGVRLLAFDLYAKDANGVECLTGDLKTLLAESDFVVLCCPLTDETRGMIDEKALAAMKRDSVLINVSRGALVDEKALYTALEKKQIAGAVLDVWWNYPKDGRGPRPSDYPFEELPNVIRTPHSCAWTRELFERRYKVIAENINTFVSGGSLKNIVNYGSSNLPK